MRWKSTHPSLNPRRKSNDYCSKNSKEETQRGKTVCPPLRGWHDAGFGVIRIFFITGEGLGASGGMNRILVFFQDLIAPNHVDNTPYLLSLAGGDLNPLRSWIVYLTVGVVLGGLVSGWLNGRIKLETNKGPNITKHQRWLFAFIGGSFMGDTAGARLARGCTSGQALSGGAVLSVGSWAFMCPRIWRRICPGLFCPQIVELGGSNGTFPFFNRQLYLVSTAHTWSSWRLASSLAMRWKLAALVNQPNWLPNSISKT